MSQRRINTALWKDALTGIPRVNRSQWDTLDLFGRWLIAIRAAVLVMTLLATMIAGVFAYEHGMMNWPRFAMVAVGLLAAHATNNILNDLSDHRRGVDKDNAFRTRYGTQPVEEGFLSPQQSTWLAVVTLIPALGTAAWLALFVGEALIPFVLAGLILVFGYNWPLKHFGLGEPTVIAVWGPLMVGGGYLAITGVWSWSVAWASLPYAIGATIVLFGKHIDKIPWDHPRGVRTLPVLLGHTHARHTVLGLLVLQFLLVVLLLMDGTLKWPVLLVLGSLPFLRQLVPTYCKPTPISPPPDYPDGVWPLWYSAYGFVHCRNFGLLYIAGLLLSQTLL